MISGVLVEKSCKFGKKLFYLDSYFNDNYIIWSVYEYTHECDEAGIV